MILMYKPEMQVRISQTFFMGFSAILPILKTKGPSKFQDPTFFAVGRFREWNKYINLEQTWNPNIGGL